jgi:hypothetical protein
MEAGYTFALELADIFLLLFVTFASATNVTMVPGDMVLYESHSVVRNNG